MANTTINVIGGVFVGLSAVLVLLALSSYVWNWYHRKNSIQLLNKLESQQDFTRLHLVSLCLYIYCYRYAARSFVLCSNLWLICIRCRRLPHVPLWITWTRRVLTMIAIALAVVLSVDYTLTLHFHSSQAGLALMGFFLSVVVIPLVSLVIGIHALSDEQHWDKLMQHVLEQCTSLWGKKTAMQTTTTTNDDDEDDALLISNTTINAATTKSTQVHPLLHSHVIVMNILITVFFVSIACFSGVTSYIVDDIDTVVKYVGVIWYAVIFSFISLAAISMSCVVSIICKLHRMQFKCLRDRIEQGDIPFDQIPQGSYHIWLIVFHITHDTAWRGIASHHITWLHMHITWYGYACTSHDIHITIVTRCDSPIITSWSLQSSLITTAAHHHLTQQCITYCHSTSLHTSMQQQRDVTSVTLTHHQHHQQHNTLSPQWRSMLMVMDLQRYWEKYDLFRSRAESFNTTLLHTCLPPHLGLPLCCSPSCQKEKCCGWKWCCVGCIMTMTFCNPITSNDHHHDQDHRHDLHMTMASIPLSSPSSH